ncbi:PucR family transcriptional regulator [Tractidigestivibacter sp.]|jgi:hypothetical protein|uniref:PucR family transcriptional regulator n=1 Tax=Tractidigestivibacter sp. TaxID=2847320 RepID=UPI003D8EFC7B
MRDIVSLGLVMISAHLGDFGATLRMNNRDQQDVHELRRLSDPTREPVAGILYLARASELSHYPAALHKPANFLIVCDDPLDFDTHLGSMANAILVPGDADEDALRTSAEACIRGMARAAKVAPRLLDVILANGRPHDALLVVAKALDCAVALYDTHMDGIDFSDKDYWEQMMVKVSRTSGTHPPLAKSVYTETFSDLTSSYHYPILVEMGDDTFHLSWASFFVKVDNVPLYLFGALEKERPLSEEDLPLIAYACEVLGTLQKKLQPSDEREVTFSLVNRLLDSSEDDPSLLFDIERAMGSRVGTDSHVIVVANPTLDHPYLYLTKIQSIVRLALPGTFNFLRGTRVVIVLKHESEMEEIRQVIETATESTEKKGWHAAVSLSFDSVEGLKLAYRQAEHAMSYGVRLKPGDALYDYRNYLIYDFLEDVSHHTRLRDYVLPVWTQIKDYDRQHDTEYGATLATYLRYSKDINRTAEILFVHRNTVRYRLERISELFGVDLEDDTTSANLVLSNEISYFCERQHDQ